MARVAVAEGGPVTATPFMRWPGGKTQLLPRIHELLPEDWRSLDIYEPFLGGGAFFWSVQAQNLGQVVLADANERLIGAYQAIRDDLPELLELLRVQATSRAAFLELRDLVNSELPGTVELAAAVIGVNRLCFNGLWRENPEGELNVGYDPSKEGTDLVRVELLTACSEALEGVELYAQDFRSTIEAAGEGSLLFVDSPYWPALDPDGPAGLFGQARKPSFTGYTAKGFNSQDHHDLLQALVQARRRGAYVIATNAECPDWRDRYEAAGFVAHRVDARRSINSDAEGRGAVGELIFVGRPT